MGAERGPVTLALLGAGNRGADAYGEYVLGHPGEFRFTAVAEPRRDRRDSFAARHGIPPEMTFASWEDLLSRPRLAEGLIVATQDRMHYDPVMAALAQGYGVLLEKPMAPTAAECVAMAGAAARAGRLLMICHVLRYTPFFAAIKKLLDEGRIGRVVSIQHNENVGYWHMAHSYVRGNWRRRDESNPMILAKSCHDMDILLWLAGADCARLASFGSLSFFKRENAPPGAAARCLDGCRAEPDCPFSARRIYLGENTGWPVSVISLDTSLAARTAALREGPYGRCVFACDNDVVDHQVAALEFTSGATAAFTMCGLTREISRTIKIMGTAGEIAGHMEKGEIVLRVFGGGEETVPLAGAAGGHAGGDGGLMRAFAEALREGRPEAALTSAAVSVQSHLMAFAAEESRLTGRVVEMADFARANSPASP